MSHIRLGQKEFTRHTPLLSSLLSVPSVFDAARVLPHLSDTSLKFLCCCLRELITKKSSKHFRLNKVHSRRIGKLLKPHQRVLHTLINDSVAIAKKRRAVQSHLNLTSGSFNSTDSKSGIFTILGVALPIIGELVWKALNARKVPKKKRREQQKHVVGGPPTAGL